MDFFIVSFSFSSWKAPPFPAKPYRSALIAHRLRAFDSEKTVITNSLHYFRSYYKFFTNLLAFMITFKKSSNTLEETNRMKIAIITASDKGSRGEREDLSGKVIAEKFIGIGEVVSYKILPDERELLANELRRLCDTERVDIILTTGGTGFAPRDVTPEATMDVVERLAPGLPEAMRAKSLEITNRAMLTRAVAGIRSKTLIVNLPGSPKAVKECLDVILPVLGHAVELLRGTGGDCAR